jgi:cytochrome c oxidase assembly protein subunit 11
MKQTSNNRALQSHHRVLAVACAALVVAMVGAAYAAVPLYRMFCQATGFDGTPRVATKPSTTVLDKTVVIRFDANVTPGLPWRFEPVQQTMVVKIGETNLAFFRATNTSDRPIRGTAIYNVFPEIVAVYFNKLQCFCFTEQLLEPGQTMEFPVSFFVDPAIVNDRSAREVTHITLSYTFNRVATPQPGVAEHRAGTAG